jgi:hypothetical protein
VKPLRVVIWSDSAAVLSSVNTGRSELYGSLQSFTVLETPQQGCRERVLQPWGVYIGADPSRGTGVHGSKSVNPHLECVPPPRSDINI